MGRVAALIGAAAALGICISYVNNVASVETSFDLFLVGWALRPVLIFAAATFRPQVSPSRVLVLGVLTLAYAALFVFATLDYDTSSTGGLVFPFVPFWGIVALALAWLLFTAFGALQVWREMRRSEDRAAID